jgi:hypothetical protein
MVDNDELPQGQRPPIIYIENMNKYLKIHYPNASLTFVSGVYYRASIWERINICIRNNLCCCICPTR